jgi:uncharacterized protein (DUF1499 family)
MRPTMIGLAALFLVLAALGIGVRLYMNRSAEDQLRPGEDITIASLHAPLPANAFLACPRGYCAIDDAIPSPIFPISVDRLANFWAEVIAGEPRIVLVASDPGRHRSVLIQRSPLFRFPDVITIELVALAPDRSSIALYSHARYGRSDFGVNRKRVLRWLSRLQGLAGPAS